MKKIILFLLIVSPLPFIPSGRVLGQNLVPNPSFEKLKTAPSCWTSGSKEDFENLVYDWFLPNQGTTDLLSTQVAPSCVTAMPYSTYPKVSWYPGGSQLPRTGNNFAGIKPMNESRREYLEAELICPLEPGKEYYCEMYVSLSERTNYAQNMLGMYFSDTVISINSTEMLTYTPQIEETAVIDDTVQWVRISGTFTATSPARFLVIGSFRKQAEMILEDLGPKGDINFSYYFIDDILVRPVSPPAVQITGDTTVCEGDAVQLKATGWPNLQWFTSSGIITGVGETLTYHPSATTILQATSDYCNWKLSRPIQITVVPPPSVSLGNDTLICEGSSLTFNAGTGFGAYQWQDGSSSQQYTATQPGIYSVTVTDAEGCTGRDEIQVGYYKKPDANLGEDLLTCTTEGMLNAATGQTSDLYEWQDLSIEKEFHYSTEGKYYVTITNVCGATDSDTILIQKIHPFVPNLITPNADHLNDHLEVLDTEKGKGSIHIYNRYGSLIYENKNYIQEWPEESLHEGVYYYQFSYPTCPDMKGWVQVVK